MDTDGDGLEDILEVNGWMVTIIMESTGEIFDEYICHPDPLIIDVDCDGLSDFQEYINGTDPQKSDSDGDGKTDLDELTGDYNSSATGIDGTPPEIWKFDCSYEISTNVLKIPNGLSVKIKVGVKDIFGLSYIAVDISGLEDKIYYCDNSQNVTKDFEWGLSGLDEYARAFTKGFKINLSAQDRNSNIGFKIIKQPSIANLVISAFLGNLIKMINIISNFISLIKSIGEKMIKKIIDGAIDILKNLADTILENLKLCIIELCYDLDIDESSKDLSKDGKYIFLFTVFFSSILIFTFIFTKINAAAATTTNVISLGSIPIITWLIQIFYLILVGALLASILSEKDSKDINGDDTNEYDGMWITISAFLCIADVFTVKGAIGSTSLSTVITTVYYAFKFLFTDCGLFSKLFWLSPYNPWGDWFGVAFSIVGIFLYFFGILFTSLFKIFNEAVDLIISLFSFILSAVGWWISLKADDNDLIGAPHNWLEETITVVIFGISFMTLVKEVDDL